MKKFLLFLTLLVFLNCCSNQESDYLRKGMKFIKLTSPNIKKKFNLYLKVYTLNNRLSKEKIRANKIENFYLSFGSFEKLNIDEGRKLLIECSEYFLSLINQDEIIKKYLTEFPFTYKNLIIHIDFYDDAGERLRDGYLSYCFLCDGNVFLCSLKEDYFAKEKIQETYQEALEKVGTQKSAR